MLKNTLFLRNVGGCSIGSSRPIAMQRLIGFADSKRAIWYRPNTVSMIDNSTRRFFFSKRKKRNRPGRSRGSLESRIKRRNLENELGTSLGSGTSFSKAYATSKNPFPLKPRSEILRYLDPWYDLATLCQKQEDLLTDKIDSATRIYGVVAALMCSLSAALLVVDFPSICQDGNDIGDPRRNKHSHPSNALTPPQSHMRLPPSSSPSSSESGSFPPTGQLQRRRTFFEHVIFEYENHTAGTSLLVSWGVPPQRLHQAYAGCCALSFYTSLTATGLAGILNAWLAATPPGGISVFAKSHSKFIALVPALLGASTLSAGTALFVGLDRSKGTPVSYFGLGGTLVGCAILCLATIRGWNMTYRSIHKLAQKLEKRNRTMLVANNSKSASGATNATQPNEQRNII
eukprot:jgi/Psemu1/292674/fgenesh1_pg.1208_\